MAGVPFEAITALATPQSIESARTLVARKSERIRAKAAVDTVFQSGDRPLSTEANHALRVAIRNNRAPVGVAGVQPVFFNDYVAAATAVESTERQLELNLAREVAVARLSLLESSRTLVQRYLVFAAPGARDFLSEQITQSSIDTETISPRRNAARKLEQRLLLYLQ
ncbi:MAG: hypothetical protein QOI34_1350, partial [Verrucomicrobiota bacterium]